MLIKIAIIAAACLAAVTHSDAATARVWTSANGKFRVEAAIEKLGEDSVTLQKAGGKSLVVPIAKLSEDDKAFLKQMRQTQFDLDGVGSISSLSDQHQWNLASKQTVNGESALVYSCMVPGTNEVLTMTITPQVATTEAQRIAHLKGNYNGFAKGFANAGMRFVDPKLPVFESPIPDSFRYSLSLERQDGTRLEARVLYIFQDSRSIFFQSLANTAETADHQLSVAETLLEK